MYAYSAIISRLDLGVIADQQQKIMDVAEFILLAGNQNLCSPLAMKYALISLQFVLHSKTEAQWNSDPVAQTVLARILSQTVNGKKEVV
jgi:hypothetical protein